MESAKAEAREELQQYKERLDAMFEEHKAVKLASTKAEIKSESAAIKKEINKEISAKQLIIKRMVSKKHKEIQNTLFEEVRRLLEDFMDTPEYMDYLREKANESLKFADGDAISFFLSSTDAVHKTALVSQIGHPVEIADESFIGGLQAFIPSKNILIDHSFSALLEAEKAEHSFKGRLPHE